MTTGDIMVHFTGVTRSRAKVAAIAALPVVGGGVGVLTSATPAAAAVTQDQQWTFTDTSQVEHTCTIRTVHEFPYNGDPQVGRGETAVFGADPACSQGTAYIAATYNDPDGNSTSTPYNTDGASTARRYAPIASGFHTLHDVEFSGCSANCSAVFDRTK
jgi:hypothetical protein